MFNGVGIWINYDTLERIKFAKCLLLTVILSLLSESALQHLLSETTSPVCNKAECTKIIKNVLLNNKKLLTSGIMSLLLDIVVKTCLI